MLERLFWTSLKSRITMNHKDNIKTLDTTRLNDLLDRVRSKKKRAFSTSQSEGVTEYPLSHSQKRIWLEQLRSKNNSIFNNPFGLHINSKNAIDIQYFELVINEIIQANEVLRSTFYLQNDLPIQKIQANVKITLNYHDLQSYLEPKQKEILDKLVHEESKKPFSLQDGPLIRFSVFQLQETEYIFLLVTHHIISDGWSNNLFLAEIVKPLEYHKNRQGNFCQYKDFVFWEQQRLKDNIIDDQRLFWNNKLQNPPHAINFLKQDIQNPTQQKVFILDVKLSKEIIQFNKKNKITPFIFFLASFLAIIYRYTQQKDLIIGIPVANRKKLEFQSCLGIFTNLLPFRYEVNPDNSFLCLLNRVNQDWNQANTNSDLPFDMLIESLRKKTDFSKKSLFEILFVYQNFPGAYQANEYHSSHYHIDAQNSQYPLTFVVEEVKSQFHIKFKLEPNRCSEQEIFQIFRHFENFIQNGLREEKKEIKNIEILNQSEKEWILSKSKHPSLDHRSDIKVEHFMSLFERMTTSNLNSTAIRYLNTEISYSELNNKADQMAHFFVERGIKPGTVVALSLDRTPQFVIAIIALFKINSSFLPLEISWPKERKTLVLKESAAKFILAYSEEILENNFENISYIDIDLASDSLQKQTAPIRTYDLDQTAYIIFTSGTTGIPKGVVVFHKHLSHYIASMNFEIGERFISDYGLTSIVSTDMGYTNLFIPLSRGEAISIVPKNITEEPSAFASFQKKQKIDSLKFTPSQLEFFLSVENSRTVLPKTMLILAGEPVPFSLIKKISKIHSTLKILISYGPTETTIGTLINSNPLTKSWSSFPILGYPYLFSECYVLDENMKLLSPGIIGEIYIGGANVTSGYLNNSDLNHKHFVMNLFQSSENKILYKTGDLARILSNGDFEFHGRIDRQIKVRGYRVELGEIDSVLERYPAIDKSISIYKKESQSIVTYVKIEESFNENSIKEFLRLHLPIYMIPSIIHPLKSIPLTPNCKIDWDALQNLHVDKNIKSFSPPRDAIEFEVLKIWKKLLNREELCIDDPFFDLGGHSFLVLELVIIIEKVFQVKIPLTTLFEKDTIRKLSEIIREKSSSKYQEMLIKLREGIEEKLDIMIHPAGGQILCYYHLVNQLIDNSTVFGLQTPFITQSSENQCTTIESIASFYLNQVEKQIPNLSQKKIFFGGWSLGGIIAYQMALDYSKRFSFIPSIIIIDQPTPNYIQDLIVRDDQEYLKRFMNQVQSFSQANLSSSISKLNDQPFEEQVAIIYKSFVDNCLISSQIDLNDFKKFLLLQKNQSFASKEYIPSHYSGQVLLIRAKNSKWNYISDESLGWGEIASQLSIRWVEGTHTSIMSRPDVSAVANFINEWKSFVKENDS